MKALRLAYITHPGTAEEMWGWVRWVSEHYKDVAMVMAFGGPGPIAALIERCDEFWLVGGHVSPEMQPELLAAAVTHTPVIDLCYLGDDPPNDRVVLPALRYL